MKRRLCLLLMLLVAACSALSPQAAVPTGTPLSPTSTVSPTVTHTPAATATFTPNPTVVPRPDSGQVPRPDSGQVPRPDSGQALPVSAPALDPTGIYIYPMPLVTGDVATIDVAPLLPPDFSGTVTVTVALPTGGELIAPARPTGFDQKERARFIWAWDTTGLTDGLAPNLTEGPVSNLVEGPVPSLAEGPLLTFTLTLPPDLPDPDPTDNIFVAAVDLYPRSILLPPEPGVAWAIAETEGFRIHYLTGSAAERDLAMLTGAARAAHERVSTRLGGDTNELLDLYVLDRVLGQGGYATSDWATISYLDRMYAPADLHLLLSHELTHRLDAAIGCQRAPSIIREGLAVMVAGGHYWPASLPRHAATLLDLGYYIPLEDLAVDFYLHQHEVGYLEAAALVTYIAEEMGEDALGSLCQAASQTAGNERAQLEAGLEAIGLGDLESFQRLWVRWLRALHPTAQEERVVRAQLHLLETMRAYQAQFDPVANFKQGVFFDPEVGETHEITADFVRRPRTPEAIALEVALVTAGEALRGRDSERAEALLVAVDEVLTSGFPEEGEAADLLAIVEASLDRNYEPYRVACEEAGCFVHALDRAAWPEQVLLWATQEHGAWRVTGPQRP